MTEKEYISLCEKYLNGSCTPEEETLLKQYQDKHNLYDLPWNTSEMGDQPHVKKMLFGKLQNSLHQPKPYLNSLKWWFAAAAVLLFISAGVYFLQNRPSPNPLAGNSKHKNSRNDILPGTTKATLILADGSRLVLDNAKKGVLTKQGNTQISKSASGILVYQPNKKDGEATVANPLNTISIPRGGQYVVELPDGSKVWLNSASTLTFPAFFDGNERVVRLTGEAYFEVTKNKAQPFVVMANGTSVQVLGTHFNVNAYTDNAQVTTTLLAGSVRMTKGNSSAMLVPGQQGSAFANGVAIAVNKADIEETMAWKNGLFVFHDENIVNVMKQVSRWYDVDVEYVGEVKDKEFWGTVSRYKNITELLNNMELTHAIHYKLQGRRLIIMQ